MRRGRTGESTSSVSHNIDNRPICLSFFPLFFLYILLFLISEKNWVSSVSGLAQMTSGGALRYEN